MKPIQFAIIVVLACTLNLALIGSAWAQNAAAVDPVKQELDAAKQRKEKAFDDAKKAFIAALDDRLTAVTNAGDLVKVGEIQAAKDTAVIDCSIPSGTKDAPTLAAKRKYDQAIESANSTLVTAYKKAVRDYTRGRKLSDAQDIQKELEGSHLDDVPGLGPGSLGTFKLGNKLPEFLSKKDVVLIALPDQLGIGVPQSTFIRSVDGGLLNRDFIFDVWLYMVKDVRGYPRLPAAIIGLGDGATNIASEGPKDAVYLEINPPEHDGGAIYLHKRLVSNKQKIGELKEHDTYIVRIQKSGTSVTFSIGTEQNGQLVPESSVTLSDIKADAPFLNDTNTHVFFGSGIYKQISVGRPPTATPVASVAVAKPVSAGRTVDLRSTGSPAPSGANRGTGQVPPDAVEFEGHWLKWFNTPVTWHSAEEKCKEMGGHLICIDSLKKQDFVWELAKHSNCWLGANCEEKPGVWKWVDGSKFEFTYWSKNQPDNAGGVQNSLFIWTGDGHWDDSASSDRFGFVCEWSDSLPASGNRPSTELINSMTGKYTSFKDGVYELHVGERIQTAEAFVPPVKFKIVAMTNSTNIRLEYAADQIIFNWENNPDELRIEGGPAGGKYKQGAGRVPVNQWVEIELEVTPDAMAISVDGAKRYYYAGDFSKVKQELSVFPAINSVVKVKSITVEKPPTVKSDSTPAVGAPQGSSTDVAAIDLLKLVDLSKDVVHGNWQIKDGALISSAEDASRIQLPYKPPEEYDFKVVFTPTRGNEKMVQICAGGGHQFLLQVGTTQNTKYVFDSVGGVADNQTLRKSDGWIKNGQTYTNIIKVRKDGVQAFLDGNLITEWTTDFHDMSLNEGWKLNRSDVLGVGSALRPMKFETIEITEISGKGEVLR